MMEEEALQNLKKSYAKIQEKYNLPSFKQMNEDFGIEKIAEFETEILVREVRKCIVEKLYNYLRFLENLINPVNASIIVFSVLKTLSAQDKKIISETYQKLAKIEVLIFEVDIDFSEHKEADFIKESCRLWNEIKPTLLELAEKIKKNWGNKSESNGGAYLG